MCNAYTVRPRSDAKSLLALVSEEIRRLDGPLVRRTGRGVVLRTGSGEARAETFRWGFRRSFAKAINNARSDHLDSPVWREAMEERRCLVPISTFFEWQDLGGGRKHAYEFRRPDGDWMWVAGLWEIDAELGPCFATITTEPPPAVAPIHDRMLAVVDFTEGLAFLQGGSMEFRPYAGAILAAACASPLKQKGKDRQGPVQGELF
ncbi:MAG: SOS response-associated peptidase [Akkermansiaceae bacterium]|jgi:putative SOS response-associated peptidase YedK|nr:SOS response-associated peptidase [Akkermansiaceae bacterium]